MGDDFYIIFSLNYLDQRKDGQLDLLKYKNNNRKPFE